MHELTYVEAIKDGLRSLLAERDDVVVYGQDVGTFGGAFKVTAGLQEEFGEERVFDTPLSESAILGTAMDNLPPQWIFFISIGFMALCILTILAPRGPMTKAAPAE